MVLSNYATEINDMIAGLFPCDGSYFWGEFRGGAMDPRSDRARLRGAVPALDARLEMTGASGWDWSAEPPTNHFVVRVVMT